MAKWLQSENIQVKSKTRNSIFKELDFHASTIRYGISLTKRKNEEDDFAGIAIIKDHVAVPESKLSIKDFLKAFKDDEENAYHLLSLMMKIGYCVIETHINYIDWSDDNILEYLMREGVDVDDDLEDIMKIVNHPTFKLIVQEGQKYESLKKPKDKFLKSLIKRVKDISHVSLSETCVVNPDFCEEGIIPPTEFFGFSFSTQRYGDTFMAGGYEFVQNSFGPIDYYMAKIDKNKVDVFEAREGVSKKVAEEIISIWDDLWNHVVNKLELAI